MGDVMNDWRNEVPADKAGPYSFWIVVRRDPDATDKDQPECQWSSHCLDLDVVSQGSSLADAYKMAVEASLLVLRDDLSRGADPLIRRAPQEFWSELEKIQDKPKRSIVKPDVGALVEDADLKVWAFNVSFRPGKKSKKTHPIDDQDRECCFCLLRDVDAHLHDSECWQRQGRSCLYEKKDR
jgi:hypothetical protein